jgi:hypothetical protein
MSADRDSVSARKEPRLSEDEHRCDRDRYRGENRENINPDW